MLQFRRACSTLVIRSKAGACAGTRLVTYPANSLADDLESEKPQDLKSPVCSYNEWDPLEEVIVGRVEGKSVSSSQPNHFSITLGLGKQPSIYQSVSQSVIQSVSRSVSRSVGRSVGQEIAFLCYRLL